MEWQKIVLEPKCESSGEWMRHTITLDDIPNLDRTIMRASDHLTRIESKCSRIYFAAVAIEGMLDTLCVDLPYTGAIIITGTQYMLVVVGEGGHHHTLCGADQ